MNPVSTLSELQQGRFSCRAFKGEQVPQETIDRILAMAQQAASWCNTQPWKLWLTAGAETDAFRADLHAHAAASRETRSDVAWPTEYVGVYQERRRDSGMALYGALAISKQDAERRKSQLLENFRFFSAPHVAILTSDASLGPYGLVDCGIYIANFQLAARAHGVDTIVQAALASHSDHIRRYLGIPGDRLIVCGISFGYADMDHPANSFRIPRAGIEQAVVRR